MSFVGMPPLLTGDPRKDNQLQRDYLVRLARSLEPVITAPPVGTGATARRRRADGTVVTETGSAAKADTEAVRKSAAELRALIIKHANELQAEMDTKEEQYNGRFLAQSDFGTWEQTLDLRIQTNAAGVLEQYGLEETTVSDIQGQMQDYFTQINGEIRRGYVADPDDNNRLVFGIAISSNLQFTGTVRPEGDYSYYQIADRQTFGLYTSSGWQFWVDGHKRGYYDSGDQKLHVKDIVADDSLQIGADWQIKSFPASHELEFVYVGGGT